MSEIQRYSLEIAEVYETDVGMIKDDFGAYVEYRDHASRIKQLEQELAVALASQAQQPAKPFIYISEDEFDWRSKSGDLNGTRSLTCITPQHFGEKHYANFTVPLYLQPQAQQSQWMPIATAPTGKEFLLAFYYRHRPHDVLRRVVTFIDKDVIALGWSEIPPAPEGEKK